MATGEAIVGGGVAAVAVPAGDRSRRARDGRVMGLPPRVAVLAMALAGWGVVALGVRCLIGLA